MSSIFPYDTLDYLDKSLQSSFYACSKFCHHYDGQAFGYHADCFAFASSGPSRAFFDATEYSFESALSEESRRYDRIQSLLGSRLKKIYSKLPLEVWSLIAREFVCECAISTVQELWLTRSSSDCGIVITLRVWVH